MLLSVSCVCLVGDWFRLALFLFLQNVFCEPAVLLLFGKNVVNLMVRLVCGATTLAVPRMRYSLYAVRFAAEMMEQEKLTLCFYIFVFLFAFATRLSAVKTSSNDF